MCIFCVTHQTTSSARVGRSGPAPKCSLVLDSGRKTLRLGTNCYLQWVQVPPLFRSGDRGLLVLRGTKREQATEHRDRAATQGGRDTKGGTDKCRTRRFLAYSKPWHTGSDTVTKDCTKTTLLFDDPLYLGEISFT